MTRSIEKTACRTPTPGKKPTAIPTWKYELLSDAITVILGRAGGDGVRFVDLPDLVRDQIDAENLAELGSVNWHVTTVKLEMEVRGDVARFDGPTGQMLRLCS